MDRISILEKYYNLSTDESVDHFTFLGVRKNATTKEIEEARAKIIQSLRLTEEEKVTHRAKIEVIGTRINKAFEVLSSFEKRAEYEKRGCSDEEQVADTTDEEKAREMFRKAKTAFQQRQYTGTATIMKSVVQLDDTKAEYFLLLGLSQTNVPTERREAEQNLNRAAEMETWNAEPMAGLGMLFYSEKLYSKAAYYFRKALELEPHHETAKKKLQEIAPDDNASIVDKVKKGLGKVFPSIFNK